MAIKFVDNEIKTAVKIAEVANTCEYHHSALTRGYFSRKSVGQVDEYKGKFGEGYIIHQPYIKSTRYHIIQYYIKKGGDE